MAKNKYGSFELTEENCFCSSVSSRKELNGDEKVLATDIKLVYKTTNDALAMFHPRMKSSFYDPLNIPQDALPGTAENHRPLLLFPGLESLKYDKRFVDVELGINVPGKAVVELEACKVDKFQIELHDGGKVTITFSVACHPNESQAGKLSNMIQSDVVVSLTGKEFQPPKSDTNQPKLEGPKADDKAGATKH